MPMQAAALIVLAFSLALAPAHGADPSAISSRSVYRSAPLARGPQNHLLLQARANGQPITFLLDTGADLSFLRADRARQFGVRLLGREGRSSGHSFPLGAVPDLEAGGVPLGESAFALYEIAQVGAAVPGQIGKEADGLLGLDLLRRLEAVIDCRAKRILFKTDPAARLGLENTTRAMGFTRIPIVEERRGYLTVPCVLRGRAGRLVLDTGSFVTALDDQAVRAVHLTTRPSPLTARGLEGRVRPIGLTNVDDLKIGGLRIAPQPLAVMDLFGKNKPRRAYTGINRIELYSAARGPSGERLFGLLGNELLDQRRAIIDLGSMSLFLK
ncbi:MAG: aspartyl protease family protein [Verrucomicrobiota bacterium]|nr:aspartyl protease family protein [Verrucomicrobiota bacterium]